MALQSWLRRSIVLALAMCCAFAVLGEFALRVAGFRYASAGERDVIWSRERDAELFGRGLYRRDEREIWKPVPGAELPWAPGEHLDESGFRGEPVPLARTPGVLRIAILGADEALGVGMPREKTWPRLLQRAIAARGRSAEILCAAVEGSTLRQGIERWRVEVLPYHPDLLLVTFAGEHESRAAPRGCSDAKRIADNGGLGFPDARLRVSYLPAVLQSARVFECARWFGEVLSGEYWDWRGGELQEQRLRPVENDFASPGVRRVSVGEFNALVRTLRDELAAEHCRLMLFPIPGEAAVRGHSGVVRDYQTLLVNAAAREKIPKLSALERFEAAIAGGAEATEFFSSGQLSERGHAFLAGELGRDLVPRLAELKF